MTNRVPTTEVIKHAVSFPRERLGEPRPIKPEAFDRWLEQVKAEAWDEGNAAGWTEANAHHENADTYPELTIANPYRQETDQ